MMAAKIAILRQLLALVRRRVFEQLDVRAIPATQELNLLYDGAWVDIKMRMHPIGIRLNGTQRIKPFAADHLDKKLGRGFDIWYGDSEVIRAEQAWYAAGTFLDTTRIARMRFQRMDRDCHVGEQRKRRKCLLKVFGVIRGPDSPVRASSRNPPETLDYAGVGEVSRANCLPLPQELL